MEFRQQVYVDTIPTHIECLLGADIGGTNSNFGIFILLQDGALELIMSLHYKSQNVKTFVTMIQEMLLYLETQYFITIKKACIAAAGVISEDRMYVKPTNLNLEISVKDLLSATHLVCILLVNDFEIVGYGVDFIDSKDLVKVNAGTPRIKANRAIVGAGTGLGKCILVWSSILNRYIPCQSEGGHADFCAQSDLELDLIRFIQKREHISCAISWEDVLSGRGIKRIHAFFASREHKDSEDELAPDEIFNHRNHDVVCYKTFALYIQLYARCAKNFALDSLALNGVYIAGGIAAKNVAMFELPLFKDEFFNCGKQHELVQNIPVYVITDYNVSLYGAAKYMLLEGICN